MTIIHQLVRNNCLCLLTLTQRPLYHEPVIGRFGAKDLLILMKSSSMDIGLAFSKLDTYPKRFFAYVISNVLAAIPI